MIVCQIPSLCTRDSIHAIVSRQMADVLLETEVDLGDITACRSELERANFGRLATDALIKRAVLEAQSIWP